MAKIIENEKGFKVIEITGREMLKIGNGDMCDNCAELSETGYYVAVMNRWFCPTCYENLVQGRDQLRDGTQRRRTG